MNRLYTLVYKRFSFADLVCVDSKFSKFAKLIFFELILPVFLYMILYLCYTYPNICVGMVLFDFKEIEFM